MCTTLPDCAALRREAAVAAGAMRAPAAMAAAWIIGSGPPRATPRGAAGTGAAGRGCCCCCCLCCTCGCCTRIVVAGACGRCETPGAAGGAGILLLTGTGDGVVDETGCFMGVATVPAGFPVPSCEPEGAPVIVTLVDLSAADSGPPRRSLYPDASGLTPLPIPYPAFSCTSLLFLINAHLCDN